MSPSRLRVAPRQPSTAVPPRDLLLGAEAARRSAPLCPCCSSVALRCGGPWRRRGGPQWHWVRGGAMGRGRADLDGRGAGHEEHLRGAGRGGTGAVPDDHTRRQAAAEGRH